MDIGWVRVLPLVRVPWTVRDVGEGFDRFERVIEMSDLVFTAQGAANGLTAPSGAVVRCNSMAGASLSLSLSLLARLVSF